MILGLLLNLSVPYLHHFEVRNNHAHLVMTIKSEKIVNPVMYP